MRANGTPLEAKAVRIMNDNARKRILLVNWCPLGDAEGGGVGVYQKNLAKALGESREFVPVVLDTGFYFEKCNGGRPFFRKSVTTGGLDVEVYDLVNSSVMAPMKSPAENIDAFVNDDTLVDAFEAFLREQRIDVVHFNNLEGLPLECLTVKDRIPGVRFVYSLHNYTAFCPAVNLWTSDCENCFMQDRADCQRCMAKFAHPNMRTKKRFRRRKNARFYLLGRLETHIVNDLSWRFCRGAYEDAEYGRLFEEYRSKQVAYLNRYCDDILAVSQRVAHIARTYGIAADLLRVEYIGTRFALDAAVGEERTARNLRTSENLRLAYLGYMKPEKGLPFLLDTLAQMPEEYLARMELTVAAKATSPRALAKLLKVKPKLAKLTYRNGYAHGDIPMLLEDVDLGLVPVLWEDNLPQIAIEFAAHGVPVLASSFGGASETTTAPGFVFQGADQNDLARHLMGFANDKEALLGYWKGLRKFPSMSEHIEALAKYYRGSGKAC